LRLATFLGSIAVGRYASWEEIDIPSAAVTRRAGIDQIETFIGRLREDLERLAPTRSLATAVEVTSSDAATGLQAKELRYFKLTVEPNDFFAAWMESLGLKLVPVSRKAAATAEAVVVNCFDVSDERLAEFLHEAQPSAARILFGNELGRPASAPRGSFTSMPCSFGALAQRLRGVALGGSKP
jgi:hypothetical protein